MGHVKLPHVQRIKRGSRLLKYHRKTRARLPDLPEDHPDFIAAWAAEEARQDVTVRAKAGTLAALIEMFLRDEPKMKTWSSSYRKSTMQHLHAIAETGGEAQARHIQTRHIQSNIDALPPNVANRRKKAWRALMAWGAKTGHIPADPALQVKGATVKTEGHKPWPAAMIAAFREKHPIGSEIRLGFETVYWTGARCVDARLIGPRSLDGGMICYRQKKTGGLAYVPFESVPPAFLSLGRDLDILRQCINRAGPRLYWTQTRTGQPRSQKGFSNWISDAAGPGYSAHGLRKNRLMALAECGGTAIQLQAWCGHESMSEVETYIRAASRRSALMGRDAAG